ncbi:MAG: cohesin domain-containing protein [Candidatus Poribacteria bacterium]|nr:cohesin domain-containing protein [Candidatus Poribacteria bacterium]
METQILMSKCLVLMFIGILMSFGMQGMSYGAPNGVCEVGDVLSPGQSCTYPDTDVKFSVNNDGAAQMSNPPQGLPWFLEWLFGAKLNDSVNFEADINGKAYNFAASKRVDGNWEIEAVSGEGGEQPDPPDAQNDLGQENNEIDEDKNAKNEPIEVTTATPVPLTEATLDGSVVTLTLSGRTYASSIFDIRDAVTVSGINGVTMPWHQPKRKSDTEITIELEFDGNINTDSSLTFIVSADAIANYDGPALTAQISVSAGTETLEVTTATPVPLTEATLDGSVVTLTLSGRTYASSIFDIRDAVTVSGINGVTMPWHQPKRKSDTEITIELEFDGNINTDSSLTFIVSADAIANYDGPALTAQISVSAGTETPKQPSRDPGGTQQPTASKQPETPEEDSEQDYIRGPWLWMVVPTRPEIGQGISTEIDSLADASGGAVTEAHVAQNGVSEGDSVGQLRWTNSEIHWPGHQCNKYNVKRTPNPLLQILTIGLLQDECIDPTVCWANNISNVVSTLGMDMGLDSGARTAYALINLISPSEQRDVILRAKSGDAIKIWLNGNVVHREAAASLGCRKVNVILACDPEVCRSDPAVQESKTSSFSVTLKPGNNLLLVKVRQHGEYWDMRVGLAADFTTAIPKTGTNVDLPPSTTPETSPIGSTLSILPASVVSPGIGEQLALNLNIEGGESVAGYQASVRFDTTALRFVSGVNGEFLPAGGFFVQPKVEGNLVKLNAASLAGESNGDGTLATLTFEVIAVKASTLTLSDVLLSNKAGDSFVPQVENAQITEPTGLKEDVNSDGIVNIQDLVLTASSLGQTGENKTDVNSDGIVNIQDLVLVAGVLGTSAAAPSLFSQSLSTLTAADVKLWLSQVQQVDLIDTTSQRGTLFLEQLLVVLTPKETALLANYPNPFNPETWIPYQLSKPADITLHIYAANGRVVRTLSLGHQPAGMYQSRSRAAYWDGKNEFGEQVASGLYFYTLTAGNFTATRRMLILK